MTSSYWPFQILDRVENVASRLALPPKLSMVHNMFHILMISKNVHDLGYVANYQQINT